MSGSERVREGGREGGSEKEIALPLFCCCCAEGGERRTARRRRRTRRTRRTRCVSRVERPAAAVASGGGECLGAGIRSADADAPVVVVRVRVGGEVGGRGEDGGGDGEHEGDGGGEAGREVQECQDWEGRRRARRREDGGALGDWDCGASNQVRRSLARALRASARRRRGGGGSFRCLTERCTTRTHVLLHGKWTTATDHLARAQGRAGGCVCVGVRKAR